MIDRKTAKNKNEIAPIYLRCFEWQRRQRKSTSLFSGKVNEDKTISASYVSNFEAIDGELKIQMEVSYVFPYELCSLYMNRRSNSESKMI